MVSIIKYQAWQEGLMSFWTTVILEIFIDILIFVGGASYEISLPEN